MYWPPVSFYTAVPSPPVFGIPTGCGGAAGCKRAGTAARNPTVPRCFYRNTGGIPLLQAGKKGFHDGVVINLAAGLWGRAYIDARAFFAYTERQTRKRGARPVRIPYVVGMGAAYTAALCLLVRRVRLPGRGVPARKSAVQPLLCGHGGGVRRHGQPPRGVLAVAAGAAVLCGGGCGAGALQPPAPSGPVFGRAGSFSGRARPVCVGPVPAAAHRLAGAAGRGAGGRRRGGAVGPAGDAHRADAPLGGAVRGLCLGTAGQGAAVGFWHSPALVLSGAGGGCVVFGSRIC